MDNLGTKYLLVISGQVSREGGGLKNFWSGFVNVQKALSLQPDSLEVVGHSWNPEHDDLVRRVYAPVRFASERQPSFVPEYMPRIRPVDRFESGLKRSGSTWARVNPQALLGNAHSRSRAMSLMPEDAAQRYAQVIAARWDLGMTGSRAVNLLVHDPALPAEYLYLAYYSEIDEGYADMWFVAPPGIAALFRHYDDFALECLAGENGFVDAFTRRGWPLSLPKRTSHISPARFVRSLLRYVPVPKMVALASRLGGWGRTKALGIAARIERYRSTPEISGENAYAHDCGQRQCIWPAYQALNNHAILKYFVLEKGIRAQTRFLDADDFAGAGRRSRGAMINPFGFAYVIYSHSSFSDCWAMALGQARRFMPASCQRIVLICDDSEASRLGAADLLDDDAELLFYDDGLPYTERLRSCFSALAARWPIVYFSHEDMPLVRPLDEPYLNALLHYMANSAEHYIKLVDTTVVDEKTVHPGFPGLVSNMGGYAVSVQPALIKADVFASFLAGFGCGIYDFELMSIRSNFRASAVAGSRKIGKCLLSNDRFPHICTAISKGKWCTSEWERELEELARVYDLDLDKRGRV